MLLGLDTRIQNYLIKQTVILASKIQTKEQYLGHGGEKQLQNYAIGSELSASIMAARPLGTNQPCETDLERAVATTAVDWCRVVCLHNGYRTTR